METAIAAAYGKPGERMKPSPKAVATAAPVAIVMLAESRARSSSANSAAAKLKVDGHIAAAPRPYKAAAGTPSSGSTTASNIAACPATAKQRPPNNPCRGPRRSIMYPAGSCPTNFAAP